MPISVLQYKESIGQTGDEHDFILGTYLDAAYSAAYDYIGERWIGIADVEKKIDTAVILLVNDLFDPEVPVSKVLSTDAARMHPIYRLLKPLSLTKPTPEQIAGRTLPDIPQEIIASTIGGAIRHDGPYYCFWSDNGLVEVDEVLAGEKTQSSVLRIPERVANGWLGVAIIAEGHSYPISGFFNGNTDDIVSGGFTQLANLVINGDPFLIGLTNAEQNAAILGTGRRTLTLHFRGE